MADCPHRKSRAYWTSTKRGGKNRNGTAVIHRRTGIVSRQTLEQGREVFALPGKVDSNTSFGTNGLIKQGAKLVSCVEDILEEFDLTVPQHCYANKLTVSSDSPDCAENRTRKLSLEESLLYGLISGQSISLDDLIEKTEFSIPKVTGILLNLQIRKLIKQLPGKQFIRISNE